MVYFSARPFLAAIIGLITGSFDIPTNVAQQIQKGFGMDARICMGSACYGGIGGLDASLWWP